MWETWLQHWVDLLDVPVDLQDVPNQLTCASAQGEWVIERADTQVITSLRFVDLGHVLPAVAMELFKAISPGTFEPLTLRYGYHPQLGLMLFFCFSLANHEAEQLNQVYQAFSQLEVQVGQLL